eukprot:15794-Heterococcus_DN1.PRE.2
MSSLRGPVPRAALAICTAHAGMAVAETKRPARTVPLAAINVCERDEACKSALCAANNALS